MANANRRQVIRAAAASALTPWTTLTHLFSTATAEARKSTSSDSQAIPLELWYDAPAERWTEALPVGNGRLGAMIFEGVGAERLQLNEDTLWTGGPRSYDHPRAAEVLPQLRELLFAGKQKQAESLAAERFKMTWQPNLLRLLIRSESQTFRATRRAAGSHLRWLTTPL